MSVNKPLEGVRVVELSTHVSAPSCGRLLTDWGADVIKVERPEGDDLRDFGIAYGLPANEMENPIFDQLNGNKRGIALDLKTPDGKEAMFKLLSTADIFLTNNRAKALVKNGLDYETLSARFPRLIYATITGYGDIGPDKDRAGMDTSAFWGRSGFLVDLSIDSEYAQPVGIPSGMGDLITSGMLFGGITTALYAREKTGKGDYVTISLFGAAAWVLNVMTVATQEPWNRKYPRTRLETSPTPYKTKDGEWIIPSVLVGFDKFLPALCRATGRSELIEDPRFSTKTNFTKPDNLAAFIAIMEQEFAKKTADEWQPIFDAEGVNYSRLGHMKDILNSEQALINGYVREHTSRNGHKCRITVPPIQSRNVGLAPETYAPKIGEHTAEILRELGYSEQEIQSMCESGAVRDNP